MRHHERRQHVLRTWSIQILRHTDANVVEPPVTRADDSTPRNGTRMRISAGMVGCVAGMMLALAVPPAAQADDADVIRAARSIGILNRDVNIISAGRSVCYVLRLGNRPPEEISA